MSQQPQNELQNSNPNGKRKAIIASVLLVVLLIGSKLLPLGQWLSNFSVWIQGQGWKGWIYYILVYGIGTALFFPGSLLTIMAGAAFGIVRGSILALLGALIGAAFAFACGRYFFRKRVEQMTAQKPGFENLDDAIAEHGWKIVFLLRLSPLFPFNALNYALGLTKVSFRDYMSASALGMVPGTFLYVYLGHLGKASFSAKQHSRSPQEYVLLVAGLIATIALSVYLGKIAKKALGKTGVTKPLLNPAKPESLE